MGQLTEYPGFTQWLESWAQRLAESVRGGAPSEEKVGGGEDVRPVIAMRKF